MLDDVNEVGKVLSKDDYGDNILTKGNTLLAEEEINMCTVLRMNRRFMEFMRKYHPDAANQRFKMTVISEDFLDSSD